MNEFEKYHPGVLLFYYVIQIFITMFTTNPVILGISLAGGSIYYFIFSKGKGFWGHIAFYIPLFLLIAVTNPIFSHNGETVLFFLNDLPITLEAVYYGLDIALMIIAVIFWFKSFTEIMTSDKIVFLFGKVTPKFSLILTMSLRFVPLLKEQVKKIHNTQKTMGIYSTDSLADRLLGGLRVFSALMGWSLENAIDTADSMKARGYGTEKRTNFGLYRIKKEDIIIFGGMAVCAVITAVSLINGRFDFKFYPIIYIAEPDEFTYISYFIYGIYSLIPAGITVKENIKWKLLISKI